MNTLAQQMLLQSAKLDQNSDLPSNASQANVVFHVMYTSLTHSHTKNTYTTVSIMLLITMNAECKHNLCIM